MCTVYIYIYIHNFKQAHTIITHPNNIKETKNRNRPKMRVNLIPIQGSYISIRSIKTKKATIVK